MKRNLKRGQLGSAGMTVTEVVVAFALIVALSLLMVNGFLGCAAYIRRGLDARSAAADAAAGVEKSLDEDAAGSAVMLGLCRADGSQIASLQGKTVRVAETVNGVEVALTVFLAQ